MYQVSIQNFSGPLDLLLQLVEKKHLEITELSLSQVTQEYLTFLNEQQEINPEDLADFLVVASTLLLIKSRSILPSLTLTSEEESEIMDLETRLKIYKLYKEAGEILKKMFKKEIYVLDRPSWKNMEPTFSPPPNFSLESLKLAFTKILQDNQSEQTLPLVQKKIQKISSLEERLKELLQKITHGKIFRFQDLAEEKNDKIDLIVTFLAVLHLVKQKIIKIQQKDNFGEIWISTQS